MIPKQPKKTDSDIENDNLNTAENNEEQSAAEEQEGAQESAYRTR